MHGTKHYNLGKATIAVYLPTDKQEQANRTRLQGMKKTGESCPWQAK